MKSIASTIERALRLQADQYASVKEHDFGSKLSPFLHGAFDTYVAEAMNERFYVAQPCGEHVEDPGTARMAAALENAIDMPVILYFPTMRPALKRSLIKERRGFVSAAGDLYLPHMALSLAAPSSNTTAIRGDFTPSEQALFLYCLYCEEESVTQGGAMAALGISSATASRALSSLAERGLVDYEVGGSTGRLKEYFVPEKKAFYRDGMAKFGNPIQSYCWVNLEPSEQQLPFSGLSALSSLSDLTRPTPEVVATSRDEAKELRDRTAHHMKDGESQQHLMQVLRYDPRPLARMAWGNPECVDPVTMLLTLDDNDERISMAVREVMGRFEWYAE